MRLLVVVLLLVGCRDRDAEEKAAPPRPPEPEVQCNPVQVTACSGDDVVECTDDGQFGKKVQACKFGCRRGACRDTCAVKDVELIYVVDDSHRFMSFDPRKLPGDPFTVIGKLTCEKDATPFSMAIDNHGVAWVQYNNSKIYRVSILDARCSGVGFRPVGGAPERFGMGFVGGEDGAETLYAADSVDDKTLGTLDITQEPPRFTAISTITADQTNNPELTGTGDGKLVGYFPEDGKGFVLEIDPKTGKPSGPRRRLDAGGGEIGGYAFAHYGGVFYAFITFDGNSMVHSIDRKTGKHERVLEKLPHPIVGAGVSTCAPLVERQ